MRQHRVTRLRGGARSRLRRFFIVLPLLCLFPFVVSNFAKADDVFFGVEQADWTVPEGLQSATIVINGANGGDSAVKLGGLAGSFQATLFGLTGGQSFHLCLGGPPSGSLGGFNGGGIGGHLVNTPSYDGLGGGGSTDIRINAAGCGSDTFSNRVLIAAGGGGAGGGGAGTDGGEGGFRSLSQNGENGGAFVLSGQTLAGGGGGGTGPAGGTAGQLFTTGFVGLAGSSGSIGLGGAGGNQRSSNTCGAVPLPPCGLQSGGGGGGGGGFIGGGGGGSGAFTSVGNGGGGGGGGAAGVNCVNFFILMGSTDKTCAGDNALGITALLRNTYNNLWRPWGGVFIEYPIASSFIASGTAITQNTTVTRTYSCMADSQTTGPDSPKLSSCSILIKDPAGNTSVNETLNAESHVKTLSKEITVPTDVLTGVNNYSVTVTAVDDKDGRHVATSFYKVTPVATPDPGPGPGPAPDPVVTPVPVAKPVTVVPPAVISGQAKLSNVPRRCVKNGFAARVQGRQIIKVTVMVDRKKVATIRTVAKTKNQIVTVRVSKNVVKKLRRGNHTLSTSVQFSSNSKTKPTTPKPVKFKKC